MVGWFLGFLWVVILFFGLLYVSMCEVLVSVVVMKLWLFSLILLLFLIDWLVWVILLLILIRLLVMCCFSVWWELRLVCVSILCRCFLSLGWLVLDLCLSESLFNDSLWGVLFIYLVLVGDGFVGFWFGIGFVNSYGCCCDGVVFGFVLVCCVFFWCGNGFVIVGGCISVVVVEW